MSDETEHETEKEELLREALNDLSEKERRNLFEKVDNEYRQNTVEEVQENYDKKIEINTETLTAKDEDGNEYKAVMARNQQGNEYTLMLLEK